MAYADKRDGKLTGSWVGEAPKLGKKRRFKTRQEAQDYETFVRLMGREPPTIEDAATPTGAPTFSAVAALAKRDGGPRGKWHAERDRSRMQRLDFCEGVIGTYEIQRVDRNTLKRIVAALENRPASPRKRGTLSPATINRYLAVAHSVLTYAHNEGLLKEHPPAAPYLDEAATRKERDILQLGQEEVVLRIMREAGHEVDALCVEALIETGWRSGEVLKKLAPDQITIEQVEDEEGTPVPVGVVRLHRGQTKNNSHRVGILSADLALKLRALIVNDALPDGIQLLRHFKSACKSAGYTGNLVIHSLRHTRNTRLRKAGISKDIRKRLLGHMSDEANAIYDHTDLQDHLQVAKKVEEYAGKRGKSAASANVLAFGKVS